MIFASFNIALIVIIALTSALPSQHNRRSVPGVGDQPEVVVRGRLEEERRQLNGETNLGAECINFSQPKMGLFKLTGRDSAKCNDGTDAGYYLLRRPSSRKWIIYLQGGWYCADEESCKLRMAQIPSLTGSASWRNCKTGDGIISMSSTVNPHLYDANMIYIPYCSSDVWSGTVRNRILGDMAFSFMGSAIVEQVVRRLIHNHGMLEATSVVMAGSSAGGTGVLLNIDRVQRVLTSAEIDVRVRGVVDSAWYLLRPDMENDNYCRGVTACSPVAMLKRGVHLWRPNMPPGCLNQQKSLISMNSPRSSMRNKSWKCFFGHVVYPHIKADVFVVQMLFDEVQFLSDRVSVWQFPGPITQLQSYIYKLYRDVKASLIDVGGVFASSCVGHAILTSSDWSEVAISHVRLPDAIQCWELRHGGTSEQPTNNRPEAQTRPDFYDTINETSDVIMPEGSQMYQEYYYEEAHLDPDTCQDKVIDPCSLPHCNPSCPPLYHPNSYREINAVQLNRDYLGIDISSMAGQLNMSVNELLRMMSDVYD
ncbi:palmitoleoyl-protein carboxylesterase notum1-like [Clavelina lepadiformis]|uniref:palmitoleoyl-protein carboxylesterase notum1-like n=1 Tax=Clavelina lepadiformis TaxID=159417 RepID=UPI004042E87C